MDPQRVYQLRIDLMLQGPGMSGSALRISEERAVQVMDLHTLTQLLVALDQLVAGFTGAAARKG